MKTTSSPLTDDLVTKAYLDLKLKEVKFAMIKWITAFLLAQTGVIAALVKLL